MFAKMGNNNGLENLRWIEERCVHETQKRVWSYLQLLSSMSQMFYKYLEQDLYKILFLFSELSFCPFTQVFFDIWQDVLVFTFSAPHAQIYHGSNTVNPNSKKFSYSPKHSSIMEEFSRKVYVYQKGI